MTGEERRKEIIRILTEGEESVSGSRLAYMLKVSRQIVVQDIALLRAEGYDIFSTNRGYMVRTETKLEKVFYVHHGDGRIQEELNLIVDLGGTVKDVFIKHEVYGELRGELAIDSRKKVQDFMSEMQRRDSSTLNTITSGYHYHTVLAESMEILTAIEEELKNHGFLAVVAEEEKEK